MSENSICLEIHVSVTLKSIGGGPCGPIVAIQVSNSSQQGGGKKEVGPSD